MRGTKEMLHEISRIATFIESIGDVSIVDQVLIKVCLQSMTDKLKAPHESRKDQFRLTQGGCVQSKSPKATMMLLTDSEELSLKTRRMSCGRGI